MLNVKLLIVAGLCMVFVVRSSADCTYKGQTYHAGQSFKPSPCEHCHCSSSGQTFCPIEACSFTPCADPVHDPTKCCPQCPNGRTCKHTDGHIIKEGEIYRPDSTTMCSCPQNTFGLHANLALCAVRVPIDPVP